MNGIHSFTFGNVCSADYGVFVSGTDTFAKPGRVYTVTNAPGQNGDNLVDNERYENIVVPYACFMRQDPNSWKESVYDRYDAFCNALLSQTGYQELTDTYDPAIHRDGYIEGGLAPVLGAGNNSYTFSVNFNCKPYRWYYTGEQWYTYDLVAGEKQIITSPSISMPSPLCVSIESLPAGAVVYINGQIIVRNRGQSDLKVVIYTQSRRALVNGYLIDPTDGDIYVSFSNSVYLKQGTNTIYSSTDVTVKVWPNWWKL